MSLVFLQERRKQRNKEEQRLIQDCLKYLKLMGCLAFRNNSGIIFLKNNDGSKRAIRMGIPGASDIIGIMPGGKFLAIECKTKKGKLTLTQSRFLDDVQKLGGISFVVRSVDDLIENLNKHLTLTNSNLLLEEWKEKQKISNLNLMKPKPTM